MDLTERLEILKEHGWTCKYPDKPHPIAGRSVLHIEGQLDEKERDAWMCVATGFVMLWRGGDFEFDAFVVELERVPEVVVKQRGFNFDE